MTHPLTLSLAGTPTAGLIGPIGWPELLVIGLIMLLLFGRRLPEVARSLGDGIREFKKGVKDTAPDWNDTDSSKSNSYGQQRSIPKGAEHRVAQNDPVAPATGVDAPTDVHQGEPTSAEVEAEKAP